MIKREEDSWTTYEIGDLELQRLLPSVTQEQYNQFGVWLGRSPFLQANDGWMSILAFPADNIDLESAGCPAAFQAVLQAFLSHTEMERKERPVLLKINLPRAPVVRIEAESKKSMDEATG